MCPEPESVERLEVVIFELVLKKSERVSGAAMLHQCRRVDGCDCDKFVSGRSGVGSQIEYVWIVMKCPRFDAASF